MQKSNPIKGLIRYSFYSSVGHIAIYGTLVVAFGIAFLAMGGIALFPAVAVTLFATLSLVSNAEEKSNWGKFQLTTPIKRSHVITSRYAIYLIFMMVGLIVAGIFTGIGRILAELDIIGYDEITGVAVHLIGESDLSQATFMFTISGIGAALIMCSLYYPLAYTIFKGKEEGLAFITTMLAFVISVFIAWIGLRLDLSFGGISLLIVALPVVLLAISYMITTKVYEKVDV